MMLISFFIRRSKRSAVALCNLKRFNFELPSIYQNFDKIPDVNGSELGMYGGSVSLADYCPYKQVSRSNFEICDYFWHQFLMNSKSKRAFEFMSFIYEPPQEFTWKFNDVIIRGSQCQFPENSEFFGQNGQSFHWKALRLVCQTQIHSSNSLRSSSGQEFCSRILWRRIKVL